jgi:hypothetical protein
MLLLLQKNVPRQDGGAFLYITGALILFALLSFALTNSGKQSQQNQERFELSVTLLSQIQSIRASLMQCTLSNNGIYPLQPTDPNFVSTHTECVAGRCPSDSLKFVECPNITEGTTSRFVWSGAAGQFLPKPPDPFASWEYFATSSSVRLILRLNPEQLVPSNKVYAYTNVFRDITKKLDNGSFVNYSHNPPILEVVVYQQ